MKITKTERILIDPGYRVAYQPAEADPPISRQVSKLRKLKRGEKVQVQQVRVRQRPTGMSEAQLLRALENAGIGRPSTYADIAADLVRRSYLSQDGQQLVITPLGREVEAYLSVTFPQLFDLEFSANLEARLDALALGKDSYKSLLSEVWQLVENA